ncbi:MAG: efflux RND transporter permease subunit, partial [Bradyrhizobium sp.]|nr:efflux RND transporter permease subunit [Bradyrhizobium sp.]
MAAHGHEDGRIGRAYNRLLELVLRRPAATIIVSLTALVVSGLGAMRLEQQFFPPSDRPELLVSLTLPQNASFEATDVQAKRLEAMLKTDPDIDRFSTYVGAGAIRFYLPMDVLLSNDNVTQMVVVARDLDARDRVKARLDAAFRTEFADLITRANPLELGPPVGWPLKYRVTGPDVGKVREIAMQLANIVAGNAETRDVNLSAGEPQKSVEVKVRQTEARAVGLSSQDVAAALGFPIIVRPRGSHAGVGLEKVDEPIELSLYLDEREEQEFFVSRFINYASEDGLFRKYRVVFVDGVAYACHMAIARRWDICYLNAGMAASEAKRLEEAAFMQTFDIGFGRRHRSVLAAIAERIGLDYFIIDCAE